jgi:hypothetical protein
MFERYTEPARRVIFFSRYEASVYGSPYIETEHLLLGLFREDKILVSQLQDAHGSVESIRSEIEAQQKTGKRTGISTSVDLPLSTECKRVLVHAAEEAETLQHKFIDSGHLVLALIRTEDCFASTLLRKHGVDYAYYRELVGASPQAGSGVAVERHRAVTGPSAWLEAESEKCTAPSLREVITTLETLIDQSFERLDMHSDAYGEQRLKRKSWSRKEALGHLIDLATSHHRWFARALTKPKIFESGYPLDDWVSSQRYHECPWPELVNLWVSINRLLLHVLRAIPEEKLAVSCRIGIEDSISLRNLIERYVERCDDIMGQILARL